VEVGLFAMKRVDVQEMLTYFEEAGIEVDTVQMAPLALYNYMTFDGQALEGEATILADVGADKTDLVVADGPRIWTRTIQIGGNNFTEALVRAFKLSFAKAEKLKRSAATSKYARQIFQSMRPVFSDLVQEIQRSVGYYTSLHRETRFKKMLGLGSGFKLPGLQKFLEQNLNMPVLRIDTFAKMTPPDTNAAMFADNILSVAATYGLAAQGLGLTRIQSNLLPEEIETKRRWAAKRPWFVGAAAVLVAATSCMTFRAFADKRALSRDEDIQRAQSDVQSIMSVRDEFQRYEGLGRDKQKQLAADADLYRPRAYWIEAQNMVRHVLGSLSADADGRSGGQQKLLADYALDLEQRLSLERTLADLDNLMLEKPSLRVMEDALTRQKQVQEELVKVKDRIRKFMVAGTPGKESAYIDAETKIDELTAQMQKPMTSAEFAAVANRRFDTQQMLDQLVAESFAKLAIFRVAELTPVYRDDITKEDANSLAAQGARGPAKGGDAGSPAAAPKVGGKGAPGFIVTLTGRTALSNDEASRRFSRIIKEQTKAFLSASPQIKLTGVGFRASKAQGDLPGGEKPMDVRAAVGGIPQDVRPVMPDPLLPRRDMAQDSEFKIVWLLEIESPAKPSPGETR
jgi:hypothetical protein